MLIDTCILTYNTTSTNIANTGLNKDRKFLKTIDILGRDKKKSKNEILFYLYDDGTVEKKIVLE